MNLLVTLIRIYFVISSLFSPFLQKGYRSLHTAARKDFAKAAKLLLQKDHKPDIEAPVSLWTVLNFVKTIYTQSEARQKTCIHCIMNPIPKSMSYQAKTSILMVARQGEIWQGVILPWPLRQPWRPVWIYIEMCWLMRTLAMRDGLITSQCILHD